MKKNNILGIVLLFCSLAYGQMEQYDYQRELLGVEDQWHKLLLPNEIFGKISPDFSDIRIYGVTTTNDTIESPYILEQKEAEATLNKIPFKIINTVFNERGHYFTLDLGTAANINQIDLNFKQTNFDWKLTLEGSQNQKKWLTIVTDYRVLSIQNNSTQYTFSKINFSTARYRYFRLFVPTKKEVDLVAASIALNERSAGNYQVFNPKSISTTQNKTNKQTEIIVDLETITAISQLHINVQDDFDYYRPFTIQYLRDSFETEKGWKYNYSHLTSGTLNSIEDNLFTFNNTISQRFKIIIQNQDNQPLHINTITAKGAIHELTIRFTQDAAYFLTYGSSIARKAHYDIDRFSNNIPKNVIQINLGVEQKNKKPVSVSQAPLFENKAWLWGVMTLIIVLLVWFTVKMLGEGSSENK